jgi:hypothetical protein
MFGRLGPNAARNAGFGEKNPVLAFAFDARQCAFP